MGLIEKFQRDFDVFSDPLSAKSKSNAMGLGGAIHVYDVDGQAYYMPGATHKEYLEHMEYPDGDKPSGEEVEEVTEDRMVTALRAVVSEIMSVEKAEYDGEQVELNQPRYTPDGDSKKFEVFVKDGDKVKRVTFGDPDMEIRRDDEEARDNFRARHNCSEQTDKTSAAYWSCKMWEKGTTVSEATKADTVEGEILKVDDEQRLIYGWASVITEKGQFVVDRQGDIIDAATLTTAVNKFMEHVRVGKTMHNGEETGKVIHSLPITKEICDALGIQCDREGWVVAYKVYDDEVWKRVKSGELRAFSIGGRAQREEL